MHDISMQASSNAAGSCECMQAFGAQLLIPAGSKGFKAHSTELAAHHEALALLLRLPAGRRKWQHSVHLFAVSTASKGSIEQLNRRQWPDP